ncbi:hypothetical protein ACT7CW_28940 [Bacillus pacificus]
MGSVALIMLVALWKIFKKIMNRTPVAILESEYITVINDAKYPVKIALKRCK